MQSETFEACQRTDEPCPVSAALPPFFASPLHPKSSISAAEGWSAADNFLQKQRPLEKESGKAVNPTKMADANYNLKARFCCRFAADVASGEGRLNQLLRRRQPMAPIGWRSIAVTIMLTGYRGGRRI